MMKIEENYKTMGLEKIGEFSYLYIDRYSEVIYTRLQTGNVGIEELIDQGIPYFGIFTKKYHNIKNVVENDYMYCGNVSHLYNFVGNEIVLDGIRDAVSKINQPIFNENIFIDGKATKMLAEIIIQNTTNIPSQGDIYPQIIVENTYNGTGRCTISMGLYLHDTTNNKQFGFGFRNKLLSMKQIHKTNSETFVSDVIGKYVDSFSENIVDLITTNFSKTLTEEDMLSTLDLIEAVGKKRRDLVSNELTNIVNREISVWDMFLAIIKFSTIEKNINSKILMEDVAERILTIPSQMLNIIDGQND